MPQQPTPFDRATSSPTSIDGYRIEAGLVDARFGPEPDWAGLYPLCTEHRGVSALDDHTCDPFDDGAGCPACSWEACQACQSQMLTPRMALVLHTYAVVLADLLGEEIDHVVGADEHTMPQWLWGDVLPPVAWSYLTVAFAERFVAGLHTLAGRLAAGRGLWANCTGEELAVHTLLDHARDLYGDGEFHDLWGDELAALPAGGEADEDFEWLREVCLEDHDVLMLFDPYLDGIEVDAVAAAQMGLVNLAPPVWFVPFRDAAAVA